MAIQSNKASHSQRNLFLLVPAALFLLVILAWLAVDKWCERRLTAELNSLRQSNAPLTRQDINALRPAFPDDKNMALVFLRAGRVLHEYVESAEFKRLGNSLPIIGQADPPTVGGRLSEESERAAKQYLDRFQSTIAEIIEATNLKQGAYPSGWLQNPPFSDSSHMYIHNVIVKTLCMRSLVEADGGRIEDAVSTLLAALRCDAVLVHEPSRLGALILRGGSLRLIQHAVCRAVSSGYLNDKLMNEMQEELEQIEQTWSLRYSMLGERVDIAEMLNSKSGPGGLYSRFQKYNLIPGVKHLDLAETWRLATLRCDAATLEPKEALMRVREVNRTVASLPKYYIMTHSVIPSEDHTFLSFFSGLGEIRSTQAALAAERYRLMRGDWPESLDTLVPIYLDSVLLDPFDDKPLRFARDDLGIRIWSIGENERDDGGQISTFFRQKKSQDVGAFLLHPQHRSLQLRETIAPATKPASATRPVNP